MEKKRDWKKEAKEILEILVYVAISAGVVFQVNYGCTRKDDKDDASAKPVKTATIAADTIAARNAFVHNIGGKSR